MNTEWHFFVMIAAAVIVFLLMILLIEGKQDFYAKRKIICLLAFIVVVIGMLMGKYGAMAALPCWVYYPVPMLCTLLLPPFVLKFSSKQTVKYILMSFMAAPFIHACFSFFLGWKEYMPFWNIPSLMELLS